MSEPLTAGQRRTRAAREALAARFTSPQERSEHYRDLGRKSAADRRVLSGDDAAALVSAYALLGRIVARIGAEQRPTAIPQDGSTAPEVAA
jgi:hypothetical protein